MKVFITALLILTLLTCGLFLNINYLNYSLAGMREELNNIPLPAVGEQDLTLQMERITSLRETWVQHSPYISLTVNHADLMEIETQFAALLGAAYAGTRENYLVSLSQLDYALSHVMEMAQASAKNII